MTLQVVLQDGHSNKRVVSTQGFVGWIVFKLHATETKTNSPGSRKVWFQKLTELNKKGKIKYQLSWRLGLKMELS